MLEYYQFVWWKKVWFNVTKIAVLLQGNAIFPRKQDFWTESKQYIVFSRYINDFWIRIQSIKPSSSQPSTFYRCHVLPSLSFDFCISCDLHMTKHCAWIPLFRDRQHERQSYLLFCTVFLDCVFGWLASMDSCQCFQVLNLHDFRLGIS